MIFKLSRSAHEMYNIPASVGLESIYGTHNNGQGIIFTIEPRFVEPWEGTIDQFFHLPYIYHKDLPLVKAVSLYYFSTSFHLS